MGKNKPRRKIVSVDVEVGKVLQYYKGCYNIK